MKFIIMAVLIFLTSCSSYINQVHKKIDSEDRRSRQKYRKRPKNSKGIQNPVTLNGGSANSQRNNYPQVRRNYNSKGTRRYKASDLVDNQSDGSLWSGKNSESFLFVNSNHKKPGDIAIIEVMKNLKDKIQEELKRAFPERKEKKSKKGKGKKDEKKEDVAEAPAAGPDEKNKVYDKISTSVIEEVNKDYVLVRGRKEVMYKNYKRHIEFQAIASQKDITANDTINSDKLLEPKINVLRY